MLTPSELGEYRGRERGSHEARVPDFPSLIPERVISVCRAATKALLRALEIIFEILMMRASQVDWDRKWAPDPKVERGYQEWLRAKRLKSRR